MNCTLCQKPLSISIDTEYFHCQNCQAYVMKQALWLDPKAEKERYDMHKNDIYDARYRDFVSPISNAIKSDFTAKHQGLDYGCGPGPVIAKVLEEANYQVRLYDPYYQPDETYLTELYDYIFSCEVFEHFTQPKAEIEKLVGLLKPKGRIYIMTDPYDASIGIPFENWYYRKDPTHVFIYTYDTMRYIAQNFPLKLVCMEKRLIVFEKHTTKTTKS
jgi:SAM-dependent methyltransferase